MYYNAIAATVVLWTLLGLIGWAVWERWNEVSK